MNFRVRMVAVTSACIIQRYQLVETLLISELRLCILNVDLDPQSNVSLESLLGNYYYLKSMKMSFTRFIMTISRKFRAIIWE